MSRPSTNLTDLPEEILVEIGKILADQRKFASLAALRASFTGAEVVTSTLFEAVSWCSNPIGWTVDGDEWKKLDTFQAVFGEGSGQAISAIRRLRVDTSVSEEKEPHLTEFLARHCPNITSLTYHHTTTTPYYNLLDMIKPLEQFRNLEHLDLNLMPLPGFGFADFCQRIVDMKLKNLKSLTLEYTWQEDAMNEVVDIVTRKEREEEEKEEEKEAYWNDIDNNDHLPMRAFRGPRAYIRMLKERRSLPLLDRFSIFAPKKCMTAALLQLPFEAKTMVINYMPVAGGEDSSIDVCELFHCLRSFAGLRNLIVVSPVTTLDYEHESRIQPQDWYDFQEIKENGLFAKRVIPFLEKVGKKKKKNEEKEKKKKRKEKTDEEYQRF